MKIAGFQKISLQDYPKYVSCIVFTQGCNIRCPFCQNSSLIPLDSESLINEKEIFDYITLRKDFLQGVIITGGEPTIQPDLKEFILKVKEIGLKVKLDTNGINYLLLKELVQEQLVDYVAMDIKNSVSKYNKTSGVANININNILDSIELLKKGQVDYEFRTTIINEYHTLQDIYEIINMIGENSKYYLQNFKSSELVIDKTLTGFTEEKLKLWNKILKGYSNVFIRGIDKGEI